MYAGARLVGYFAQRLTAGDAADIDGLSADLLLLAGGNYDGNSFQQA
jgi:hypothetical protein